MPSAFVLFVKSEHIEITIKIHFLPLRAKMHIKKDPATGPGLFGEKT
jgi:hypothetical protein